MMLCEKVVSPLPTAQDGFSSGRLFNQSNPSTLEKILDNDLINSPILEWNSLRRDDFSLAALALEEELLSSRPHLQQAELSMENPLSKRRGVAILLPPPISIPPPRFDQVNDVPFAPISTTFQWPENQDKQDNQECTKEIIAPMPTPPTRSNSQPNFSLNRLFRSRSGYSTPSSTPRLSTPQPSP